jgi:DNA-binding beta-propeller fold protein YncE
MSGGTPDINYISEDCGPAYAIAVNPATGMVYVTTSFGGFGGSPFGCVLAIDGSTDMIVQRILLGRQAYPGALSIDTKSNTVYVADSVRPVIYVIDGSSNAQSGVINLASPYVSSMAIDTSTSKLFASHSLSSSVSEVDTTTGLLISEIPVPGRLVCLGVNAMTHMVYVTDYQGELAAFQA